VLYLYRFLFFFAVSLESFGGTIGNALQGEILKEDILPALETLNHGSLSELLLSPPIGGVCVAKEKLNIPERTKHCSGYINSIMSVLDTTYVDSFMGGSNTEICNSALEYLHFKSNLHNRSNSEFYKRFNQYNHHNKAYSPPIECLNFSGNDLQKYSNHQLTQSESLKKLALLQKLAIVKHVNKIEVLSQEQQKILLGLRNLRNIQGIQNIPKLVCDSTIDSETQKKCMHENVCGSVNQVKAFSRKTSDVLLEMMTLSDQIKNTRLSGRKIDLQAQLQNKETNDKIKDLKSRYPWIKGKVFKEKATDLRKARANPVVFGQMVENTFVEQLHYTEKRLTEKYLKINGAATCISGRSPFSCSDEEVNVIAGVSSTMMEDKFKQNSNLLLDGEKDEIKKNKNKIKNLLGYSSYQTAVSCLNNVNELKEDVKGTVELAGAIGLGVGMSLFGGPFGLMGAIKNVSMTVSGLKNLSIATTGLVGLGVEGKISYDLLKEVKVKCGYLLTNTSESKLGVVCNQKYIYDDPKVSECIQSALIASVPLGIGGISIMTKLKRASKGRNISKVDEAMDTMTGSQRKLSAEILNLKGALKYKFIQRLKSGGIHFDDISYIQKGLKKKDLNDDMLMLLLDKLTGLKRLSGKQHQKVLDKIIISLNKDKIGVIDNAILSLRRKSQQKSFDKAFRNIKKQNPSMSSSNARTLANDIAVTKRIRKIEIKRSCASRNYNSSHVKAGALYGSTSMALNTSSTTIFFAQAHWNEVKNAKWAKKLGYEVFMSYITTKWGSKISKNPKSSIPGKIGSGYIVGQKIAGIETSIYASFFDGNLELAKEKLLVIQKSKDHEESLKELQVFVEKRTNVQKVVDIIEDSGKSILDSIVGREGVDDFLASEITAISKEDLNNPVVLEKLADHIEDMVYSESLDHDTTGSVMLDRILFDTEWNLSAVPRGVLLGMFSYYLTCTNIDNPLKAIALLGSVQGINKAGSTYYYYNKKESEIKQ
jgi:hypothetical protein